MEIFEKQVGQYLVSTDPKRLNIDLIGSWLSKSYWNKDIQIDQIPSLINNALCFGVYDLSLKRQVGFGRIISDYTSFAYMSDIIVDDERRGQGIGKILVGAMTSHPNLQNLRRWVLATKDAHTLYEKFGFKALKKPEIYMEMLPRNRDLCAGEEN